MKPVLSFVSWREVDVEVELVVFSSFSNARTVCCASIYEVEDFDNANYYAINTKSIYTTSEITEQTIDNNKNYEFFRLFLNVKVISDLID